jgi:hypothetical protein
MQDMPTRVYVHASSTFEAAQLPGQPRNQRVSVKALSAVARSVYPSGAGVDLMVTGVHHARPTWERHGFRVVDAFPLLDTEGPGVAVLVSGSRKILPLAGKLLMAGWQVTLLTFSGAACAVHSAACRGLAVHMLDEANVTFTTGVPLLPSACGEYERFLLGSLFAVL